MECLHLSVLLCETEHTDLLSQCLKLSSRGQPSWKNNLTVVTSLPGGGMTDEPSFQLMYNQESNYVDRLEELEDVHSLKLIMPETIVQIVSK